MSDWVEKPLGALANFVMGQSPDSATVTTEEKGLPFLQGCAEFGAVFPKAVSRVNPPLKVAPRDSALISVRAPVGTMNQADQDYGIGRGLASIIATEHSRSFLQAAIQQNVRWLHRRSQGSTFLAIGSDDLKSLPILVPEDFRVAEKAAQVLDLIDTQIEATEALIAKQERLREGLMQDLFTRGVDENGELRPPREEAPHLYHETELGWLPGPWKTDRLANMSEKITSGSRDWASYYSLEGATFIRIGNLTRTSIRLRRGSVFQKVAPPMGADGLRTNLRGSDILVSITADLGLIGLVPAHLGEAYINQHIAMVRLEEPETAQFIALSLLSKVGQDQFQRFNDPGAKAGLNLPTVGKLCVHRPDNEEALIIGEIIGSQDGEIDDLRDSLERLRLQKSGLMQDLLTGKVSVEPLLEKEPA